MLDIIGRMMAEIGVLAQVLRALKQPRDLDSKRLMLSRVEASTTELKLLAQSLAYADLTMDKLPTASEIRGLWKREDQ